MSKLSLKDYQEDRQDRGVYDKRNTLNDLTGKEWLFSTKTVIPKLYSLIWPVNTISRNYNPIPIDLSRELVETFSKPGETVLDPFAGIGSTLIGSFFANAEYPPPRRKCIGIESDPNLVHTFRQLTMKLNIPDNGMLFGDALSILSGLKKNSIDFILSDIPVWNISETVDGEDVGMSLDRYHHSPLSFFQLWCSSVSTILSRSICKLKDSKYIVLSIPNHVVKGRSRKNSYPPVNFVLSALIAHHLQQFGVVLKSERVWFIPNIESSSIFRPLNRRFLVFRKEGSVPLELGQETILFNKRVPVGDTLIIHKAFPPSFDHKLRSEHGGMKPPELAQLLIEKYAKSNRELILDPFAGVGGTLLGASLVGKKAIGIDINERWKEIYLQVSLNSGYTPQDFLVGDARQLINTSTIDNSIGLILTDVPYWAMDKLRKTRGRFSKAGEQSRDKLPSPLHRFNQTSILTIDQWLELLKNVFSQCYRKLIEGRNLVVFIGNMYRTIEEIQDKSTRKVGKYLFLSSMLAKVLLDIGYDFENEIIWYSPDKALHVFGYPYSYIPSVVHQSILIFKK
ncbi:MAG: hypothetical protein JSV04_12975 [Candidatus Heimdallarchaeota archaeon]|nr:MAG: hypothetical protein JSV04_12975 [Candidatus Heimdallarchaeota archaeon]